MTDPTNGNGNGKRPRRTIDERIAAKEAEAADLKAKKQKAAKAFAIKVARDLVVLSETKAEIGMLGEECAGLAVRLAMWGQAGEERTMT